MSFILNKELNAKRQMCAPQRPLQNRKWALSYDHQDYDLFSFKVETHFKMCTDANSSHIC